MKIETSSVPQRATYLFLAIIGAGLVFIALAALLSSSEKLTSPADEELTATQLKTERLRTKIYYERYEQWRVQDRQQAYAWQRRSTRVIFWMAMLVTMVGLGCSFWQFMAASTETKRGAGESIAESEQAMSFKTHLISMAIKTRSIAALMMFMSLAFLLIYVLFGYPINTGRPPRQVLPTSPKVTSLLSAADRLDTVNLSKELLKEAANAPPE